MPLAPLMACLQSCAVTEAVSRVAKASSKDRSASDPAAVAALVRDVAQDRRHSSFSSVPLNVMSHLD